MGHPRKRRALAGVEPEKMTLPAMDRVSVTFALMLDSFTVEDQTEDNHSLVCNLCGESLCDVEPGDTLRVLLNTALAHSC